MATETESMISNEQLFGTARATQFGGGGGVGQALKSNVTYCLRTLAGAVVAIVVVWIVAMLFKHVHTVAYVLAGIAVALGAVALFIRNRELAR
jgi:hypothetical protein